MKGIWDTGNSTSAFPDLSSKELFAIVHPHQENSSALSTFSQKKCLLQRIQELGGKREAGGRLLLSTLFSEYSCSDFSSSDFFIFMSV